MSKADANTGSVTLTNHDICDSQVQQLIKCYKMFFFIYLDVIININIINFYKQIASVYAYKASSIDSFKNCDFSYLFPWSICSISDFTICNNA